MAANPARIHKAIKDDPLNIPVSSVVITSFGATPTVRYSSTPSAEQQARAEELTAKGADYLVIKDGATELPDDVEVTLACNGVATKTLTIQYKNADGTDGTGDGETVEFGCDPLPIDKLSGTLNGSGQVSLLIGPTTLRGRCHLEFDCLPLPIRKLRLKFN